MWSVYRLAWMGPVLMAFLGALPATAWAQTVLCCSFDSPLTLDGKRALKLEHVRSGASNQAMLCAQTTLMGDETGISPNWLPQLASGYLQVTAGHGKRNANQHGMYTIASTSSHNQRWSSYMGNGFGKGHLGTTFYMVIQPLDNWKHGEYGLTGSGLLFGRKESDGAFCLKVENGTLILVAGRGEAPDRNGQKMPFVDLNADGDQADFVYVKAILEQKWNSQQWYFIGASLCEDQPPVLYLRRMDYEGPTRSPAAILGQVAQAGGNVVTKLPATSGPSRDEMILGSWMFRNGPMQMLDGANARFAYFCVDNIYASAVDMNNVFDKLGSGQPIIPQPPSTFQREIPVNQYEPCNLIETGKPAVFTVMLNKFKTPVVTVDAAVTDFAGKTIWKKQDDLKSADALVVDLGVLNVGYYNLHVQVQGNDPKQPEQGQVDMSFGVTPFIVRSALEFREGGYRFGLKKWNHSKASWHHNVEWDERQAVDACCKLGLQWTREQFNVTTDAYLPTVEMIKRYPMNAVLKIQGYPAEFFDHERYGSIDDWKKKHGQFWYRFTVPKAEPYRLWLADQLRVIPASQNVFEIGNEPWGRVDPVEYAQLCQLIVSVIRQERPDAIIGVNIGRRQWDAQFIRAGGLKGMNMISLHPYSFTPQPERRTRMAIRCYRDFLKILGVEHMDLYTTEYGWPTAPRDVRGDSVTERQQAQRTVRQSLMLYAEDLKTLIPHAMAGLERDPNDREDWFGFFRLDHQPKPVLLAYAACARLIDGSRFVGDLWYGPGIGAMLFEKQGIYTLALWTIDGEANEWRELALNVDVSQVTQYNLMGQPTARKTNNGKLSVSLSGDVTYLVGVGQLLQQQVNPPDAPLNPDRWATPMGTLKVPARQTQPRIDGDLGDWDTLQQPDWRALESSAIVNDGKSTVAMAWDATHLYFAIKSVGQFNDHVGSVSIDFCTNPSKQPQLEDMLIYQYALKLVTPRSGQPATLTFEDRMLDEPLLIKPGDGHTQQIDYQVQVTHTGWQAEIAIPVSMLHLYSPHANQSLSACVRLTGVNDDQQSVAQLVVGEPRDYQLWPRLLLQP